MTKEQKIFSLIVAGVQGILTTNEYATGKNYETDIGNYYQDWYGLVNPESDTDVLEVRDVSASADEEQYPFQRESLEVQIVYACKRGTDTANQLRKAKADIYRMIGANLDTWRATVGGDLHPVQMGWEKEIKHEKEIFGEITITIVFEYQTEFWLVEEPNY